jgi:hypothetical protein
MSDAIASEAPHNFRELKRNDESASETKVADAIQFQFLLKSGHLQARQSTKTPREIVLISFGTIAHSKQASRHASGTIMTN